MGIHTSLNDPLSTMTEAQSTLERMALAVKNAHTAITVLKKENEGLKSENQSLKDQLAALQGKLDLCSCGNQQKETKQKNSNQKVDANNTAALRLAKNCRIVHHCNHIFTATIGVAHRH